MDCTFARPTFSLMIDDLARKCAGAAAYHQHDSALKYNDEIRAAIIEQRLSDAQTAAAKRRRKSARDWFKI